jgi:hypothetical protein
MEGNVSVYVARIEEPITYWTIGPICLCDEEVTSVEAMLCYMDNMLGWCQKEIKMK